MNVSAISPYATHPKHEFCTGVIRRSSTCHEPVTLCAAGYVRCAEFQGNYRCVRSRRLVIYRQVALPRALVREYVRHDGYGRASIARRIPSFATEPARAAISPYLSLPATDRVRVKICVRLDEKRRCAALRNFILARLADGCSASSSLLRKAVPRAERGEQLRHVEFDAPIVRGRSIRGRCLCLGRSSVGRADTRAARRTPNAAHCAANGECASRAALQRCAFEV